MDAPRREKNTQKRKTEGVDHEVQNARSERSCNQRDQCKEMEGPSLILTQNLDDGWLVGSFLGTDGGRRNLAGGIIYKDHSDGPELRLSTYDIKGYKGTCIA